MSKRHKPSTISASKNQPVKPYWAWAALGAILLLGLALRLRSLGQECPWYDEIITLRHLNSASLRSFLRQVRELNEPVPPLYFVVEYYLTRFTVHPVLALRLLSVAFSLATIVALYELTARLFGHTAGVLAAFFLAVNSHQIYYAQEVRMYALVGLLAVLSFRAFVSILRTESGTAQGLNAGLNLLLLWTQPMSLLIPFLQGLHLLAFRPRRWRVYRPWFLLNGFAAFSILVWAVTRDGSRLAAQLGWIRMPSLDFSNEFGVGGYYLAVMGADGTRLKVAVWLLLAVALVFAWKSVWRNRATLHDSGCDAREIGALLLAWLFLPAAMLCVVSLLWKPCFKERYFIFSFFPAYIILGSLTSYLKTPRARALGAAALLAFMSTGLLSLPNGPYRTCTNEMTETIRAGAKRGDLLLLTNASDTFRYDVQYYSQNSRLAWIASDDPEMVSRLLFRSLQKKIDAWVVAQGKDWMQQFQSMRNLLEEAGAKIAYQPWPGKYDAVMVHISPPPGAAGK
jgi:hypothetical protein